MKKSLIGVASLLICLGLAGCDSSPVSSSAPPPPGVDPGSVVTTGPGSPRPSQGGHGPGAGHPDSGARDVYLTDLRGGQFTLKIMNSNVFNQLTRTDAKAPASLVLQKGVVQSMESHGGGTADKRVSYCYFSDEGDGAMKDQREVVMTSIQEFDGTAQVGPTLQVKSKDQGMEMSCQKMGDSNPWRVSDVDAVLGGVAEVEIDQ